MLLAKSSLYVQRQALYVQKQAYQGEHLLEIIDGSRGGGGGGAFQAYAPLFGCGPIGK